LEYIKWTDVVMNVGAPKKGTALKSDIFSLGVIMHEMLLGFDPDYMFYCEQSGEQKLAVSERYEGCNDFLLQGHFEDIKKWHESFEPEDVIPKSVPDYEDLCEDEKEKLIKVGGLIKSMCEWDPNSRPDIKAVLDSYNEIYNI
jgi:serine/threonine protein kinase